MDVGRDAEQTELGRLAEGHRPRCVQRTSSAIRNPVGHDVAPRKERVLPSARGELPFGFGRQPDRAAVFGRAPRAIVDRIEPADTDDREIRQRKQWLRPVAGRLVPRRLHEALVLGASHRKDAELEAIDDHAMRRSLVLLAALRSHDELTSRDCCERRGE